MLNIFSLDLKTTLDKIFLCKEEVSSAVEKHKAELLFEAFLCSEYSHKLNQTSPALIERANIVSSQSHITNIALFALFTTIGISLAGYLYQRKQLADVRNVLDSVQTQLTNAKAAQESIVRDKNKIRRELNKYSEKCYEIEVKLDRNYLFLGTLLFEYIRDGEVDKAKDILNVIPKEDLNCRSLLDDQGKGLLTLAICFNQKEIIDFLLENPSYKVDEKDNDDHSALYHAVKIGNFELIEKILRHPLNKENREDIFLYAIEQGNIEFARKIENRYGINYLETTFKKDTVLHAAAKQKDARVFQSFVDEGLKNLNVLNHFGETPLMTACKIGNFAIVSYLLQSFTYLSREGDFEPIDLTLTDDYNLTLMHHAAAGGNIQIIDLLIKQGLDINIQDVQFETPLTNAIIFGREEMVEYLIKKDARITEVDFKKLLFQLKRFNEECYINIFLIFLKHLEADKRRDFIAFFEKEENKVDKIAKYLPSVDRLNEDF